MIIMISMMIIIGSSINVGMAMGLHVFIQQALVGFMYS